MMEKLTHEFFRKLAVIGSTVLLSAFSSPALAAADAGAKLEVETPKEAVVEGGVFFVSVSAPKEVTEASGLFQGRVIDFFPEGEPSDDGAFKRYGAIIGVEYGAQPGQTELALKFKMDGEVAEKRVSINVKAGDFPSEKLRVKPKFVTLGVAQKKQIARDRVVINRAYARKTLSKLWDPPAVMPIESDVTSVFGTSRVFNGKKETVHFGTDLRAPTGTPILAPMTGQVAVARFLFYTGNTVILDHGYGLFTIYGHMSKLNVKEGELVKKGSVMGLSGMTGRASGPHLHWGVNLHGTKVDPLVLVQALKQRQG